MSDIGRGRVLGVHGRYCVGVFGDSGKSTVNPLLNGHAVRSYCRTFERTSFSSSAVLRSSGDVFGNSIR